MLMIGSQPTNDRRRYELTSQRKQQKRHQSTDGHVLMMANNKEREQRGRQSEDCTVQVIVLAIPGHKSVLAVQARATGYWLV